MKIPQCLQFIPLGERPWSFPLRPPSPVYDLCNGIGILQPCYDNCTFSAIAGHISLPSPGSAGSELGDPGTDLAKLVRSPIFLAERDFHFGRVLCFGEFRLACFD